MRPARLAVAATIWSGPACAQIVSVTLQPPPRTFGVFVGDILTSTAILQVLPGTVLDPRSLPPDGPASPSVDVRRVIVGGTPTRIEIRVTYQSFFSPEQVSTADVPGYTLAFDAGGKRLRAIVPGFSYTASTFRHDLQPTLDPAALRPDHAPMPAHARNAAWQIAAGLVSMACGLVALAWPYAFAGQAMPFRKAARELARLHRKSGAQTSQHPSEERSNIRRGGWLTSPKLFSNSTRFPTHAMTGTEADAALEAMLVLHRAFDATAGRRVFADDLDRFFSSHKHFTPLRLRTVAFFETSRAVFFGAHVHAPAVAMWMGLCRDLADAERSG